MEKQNVFVGCPTHDGRIFYKTASALYDLASRDHQLLISIYQTSLLNWACNNLYAQALNNAAKHKIKWFALLHSDVVPEPMWLDKLIAIAEMEKADMLSACIAIKDEGGDVSTGISNPSFHHWNLQRLKKEHLAALPEAFTAADVKASLKIPHDFKLLVNTGCCIIRIDRPWSQKITFRTQDQIIINTNGQYQALVDSEDWNLSRQIHDEGGKVMATKAIKVDHIGSKSYANA